MFASGAVFLLWLNCDGSCAWDARAHHVWPGGARPYWIIGSDNLKILPSWHRHHELCELAVLVTCPRMGHPVDASSLHDLDLDDRVRDEILAHVLEMEPDDVSASEIRECLRSNGSASRWLHTAVEQRIHELGLYGTTPTNPAT